MNILRAFSGAILGWRAILGGRQDWARYFALTGPGLATALVLYLLLAFLILLAGAETSALHPLNIVVGLFVFGLYVAALAISVVATKAMLRWQGSILDLLVPGTYAMILFLLVGAVLAPLGPLGLALALAVIALLTYRLARAAGGWSIGISAAFAVLTVVLLVAMPMTLYMLASPTILVAP
jgi:hypothetical protein